MAWKAGKTLKNILYSIPVALMTLLPSCEPKYESPTAGINANPKYGDAPLSVNVRGYGTPGTEEIKAYILHKDDWKKTKSTPFDTTLIFNNEGNHKIYMEVTDEKNKTVKSETVDVAVYSGPFIEQSVNLNNEINLRYSATLSKVNKAELKINREGILISTKEINDVNPTGEDYQNTFTYSSDGFTKGNYEFVLKSDNLEKKISVDIPNYKPTGNFTNLNLNLEEDSEINVNLPNTPDKISDKNPEDNPVAIKSATSLDGKTQVTLNGYIATIKGLKDKIGSYQVEVEFGSTIGGLEKATLEGQIIAHTWKYLVNPFVQPNDSTLNWYGSGDANKDNVLNSQDVTRIIEIINGTYSNPSDTRLKDRADVNGDEVVNNQDKQLLENRINGIINYLPGEWNKLTTKAERVNWLTKMLEIDKTDELQYIPGGWVCGDFARQIVINFHGFGELGFQEELGLKDNGRFNIRVNYVFVLPTAGGTQGHAINGTSTGNNLEEFQDETYTEPQTDWIVYPGMYNGFPANCELTIKMPFNKNRLDLIEIIKFRIENSVPSLIWINQDPNLNIITER